VKDYAKTAFKVCFHESNLYRYASVTIEDVVVVIDSGRVKERQWDARRGMASLEEGWVSRAAARQRAGRAGRVRAGTCYALFTSHRATALMRNHQVPEMHRVPLTEVVLQIKKLGVGESAEAFLAGSLEPPAAAAVALALGIVREVGAVDATDAVNLTPLGHHLASLPVDCRVAKMLVYGALLSCLSPKLTVAACLSYKSPFLSGDSGGGAGGGGGAAAGDAARKVGAVEQVECSLPIA
jgi:ATP-dependent RNA helicase DHX29